MSNKDDRPRHFAQQVLLNTGSYDPDVVHLAQRHIAEVDSLRSTIDQLQERLIQNECYRQQAMEVERLREAVTNLKVQVKRLSDPLASNKFAKHWHEVYEDCQAARVQAETRVDRLLATIEAMKRKCTCG